MERTWISLRRVAAGLLLLASPLLGWAANTKTTVEQVTQSITLSDDVDYIVTSATPFASDGVVDISNTEHAVLILNAVRPSAAIPLLANHVTINGQKAVNNQNCQVKLHNMGCIIMPYDKNIKPLTVYSEQNFGGEAVNDFGLEHSGGYMNTLTTAKLNNRIRSFKLKRGYMVTFANRAGGRGYSRCFIAADKDLEVAELPGVLDLSISSYRVFTWYDTGKKNLANYIDRQALTALNVQSSYDWGQGNNSLLPDFEWVPNHIYEDYPSSATIGSTTQSPHTKNNNEPRNSADDHPQDLTTILNNWENMMRTGLRLCSPASWDGSDYWNATGFLAEFLDSIDARGWRCDIIDLHCYWAEGNFGNIANWVNKYKRPVWISEWCWGASWSENGAFANGVTETQVRDALQRICTNLNNWDYVERYYYWNSERDPSRLYKNGNLTPAGRMYAALDGGVGYNGRYDFAPKVPTQKDPDKLTIDFDKLTATANLKWYEYNGDMNVSITVQRRHKGDTSWTDLADVEKKDKASYYTYTDNDSQAGDEYRVAVIDGNRKERYTKVVTAVSNNLEAGDPIDANGTTKYLGGNIFVNGDFDMGFYGWTDGQGNPIGRPFFQVVPMGSIDGGSYLQAYGTGTGGNATNYNQAIKTVFDIDANSTYYYSGSFANGSIQQILYANTDGTSTAAANNMFSNKNYGSTWDTQFTVFESQENTKALLFFRTLQNKAQIDKQMLCKLFDTRDEAINDGVAKAKLRAEAFQQYNTLKPALNDELAGVVAAASEANAQALSQITTATNNALKAYNTLATIDSLTTVANALIAFKLYGYEAVATAVQEAQAASTAIGIVEAGETLSDAISEYLKFTPKTTLVKQPKFVSTTGWQVKCGTYTQGDQRTKTDLGTTFWNAWWSGVNASEGQNQTMEVKQEITNLPHGLYTLQCKAMTEHYCLSDQHAYITSATETAVSPALTADRYDLATKLGLDASYVWETLTTTPVYVEEGGSLTIGFIGSKQGATDNDWREIANNSSKGDKREGWWCATDFQLNRAPVYRVETTPGQFYAVCLPYATRATEGMHMYNIVGITPDYKNLCLDEITENAAGMPCVFKSDGTTATFSGSGSDALSAKAGLGNTFGTFKATSCPKNWYIVVDGQWVRQSSSTPVPAYTAFLMAIAEATGVANTSDLLVQENWEGETMPIVGADEEHEQAVANAISIPTTITLPSTDGLFTIDGRQANEGQTLRGGIYIRISNGKAQKVIIK